MHSEQTAPRYSLRNTAISLRNDAGTARIPGPNPKKKRESARRSLRSASKILELRVAEIRWVPLQILIDPILDLARKRRRRPDHLLRVGYDG